MPLNTLGQPDTLRAHSDYMQNVIWDQIKLVTENIRNLKIEFQVKHNMYKWK